MSQRILLSAILLPKNYIPSANLSTSTKYFKATNNDSFIQLPYLPVPSLDSTVINFLLFAKQFQKDHDEFLQTLEISRDFVRDVQINNLQSLLIQRAKNLPNWLTPWWLNIAYLEARTPLPIVTSPGMTFPKLNFSGVKGQVEYATKIITAALNYHHKIISNEIPPENYGKDFVDMSQYYLMFGTTRIPQKKHDIICYGKDLSEWARHIIVTRNGHSFRVPVYSQNNERLSISQLQSQLLQVIAQSEHRNEYAINIVSTNNRDIWANVYERIKKSSSDSVKAIKEALFVLSLDENNTNSKFGVFEENMRQALHGGGSFQNTHNRWFDKALQFNINDQGFAGFTYEHTPAEGPPFAALIDYIQDQLTKNEFDLSNEKKSIIDKPLKLNFLLADDDKVAIQNSSRRIDKAIDDLEVKHLTFDHFGKKFSKAAGISPDSFIQISMQLAFYNIHGTHAPTYETASLRRFAYGRTETIRLPNSESVAFVESASKQKNGSKIKELLLDAVKAHKSYTNLAMSGMAIDRHLLGLKLISYEQNFKLPELYNSKAYNKLMHFRLSSSQVPTRNILPMGYGPSENDCYGVCYNPKEESITFTITAFNNYEKTSAQKYANELEASLLHMKDILT